MVVAVVHGKIAAKRRIVMLCCFYEQKGQASQKIREDGEGSEVGG